MQAPTQLFQFQTVQTVRSYHISTNFPAHAFAQPIKSPPAIKVMKHTPKHKKENERTLQPYSEFGQGQPFFTTLRV